MVSFMIFSCKAKFGGTESTAEVVRVWQGGRGRTFSGAWWDGFGEIGDTFHLGLCIISYFSFAVKRPHD